MKHILTLGLLLLFTTSLLSQDTWVKTFGGIYRDYGKSVTITRDNGMFVSGTTFSNNGVFEGMNRDNRSGRSSDIFVLRIDSVGQVIWSKTFGGTDNDNCISMVNTPDGGVILTGTTFSNDGDFFEINHGDRDIFLMKLDSNGAIVWVRTYGGLGIDESVSLTPSNEGGWFISGSSLFSDGDYNDNRFYIPSIVLYQTDTRGDLVTESHYRGDTSVLYVNSMTRTSSNKIVMVGGSFDSITGKDHNVFIINVDLSGKILWSSSLGGMWDQYGWNESFEVANSVVSTSDGGVVVTGSTNSNDGFFDRMNKGKSDIFLIRFDSLGVPLWKRTIGGSRDEGVGVITLTPDNSFILVGTTTSVDGDFRDNQSGESLFISKHDDKGNIIWSRCHDGYLDPMSVCLTNSNDIIISGGRNDIFIMKLDSNGNLNQSTSVNEQTSTSTPLLVTPNPLSTSSTITYTLDTSSLVRIELMNTLGQVIDVVFDGYRDLGTQRHPLNVTSMTSGMYTVRMTSDNGVYTTQVCVVR